MMTLEKEDTESTLTMRFNSYRRWFAYNNDRFAATMMTELEHRMRERER